jgi:hypothetical protein
VASISPEILLPGQNPTSFSNHLLNSTIPFVNDDDQSTLNLAAKVQKQLSGGSNQHTFGKHAQLSQKLRMT